MKDQKLEVRDSSFHYVVELMVRFMQAEKFFVKNAEGKLEDPYLVGFYSDFLNGDAVSKRLALQKLGDICLVVSGFFSDSLNRKLVDVDYYHGMGGTAYWNLSKFNTEDLYKQAFEELAHKFKPFTEVLSAVSEKSGVTNNQDILRLYEKWLLTGSERLESLLKDYGIKVPVKFDPSDRH